MTWGPSEFLTAMATGVETRPGYVYRGLGLYLSQPGSPKGRRKPLWCLVHLGSGHAVFYIKGKVADAFPVATEVAECSDWAAFDGLAGWKNTDPELEEKVRAIYWKHVKRVAVGKGGGGNQERAREVATRRSN